jgi:hypothetical protein
MKTLKEKFGQYVLGQAEMQAVKGGQMYNCQCNGTGTWTGNYSGRTSIENAINTYCENGGTCTAA